MHLRNEMDAKRVVMDEKRIALDALRSGYQQVQRNQFEAEKKVVIADTSIQNLSRAVQQIDEDKVQRDNQRKHLADDLHLRERELNIKRTDLDQLQKHQEYTKDQILQTQGLLETLRSKLAEESRKLDSKKNEHDLLKSLIDSMEGYPDSVKFLHNNQGWNHTAPILYDIIYVRED